MPKIFPAVWGLTRWGWALWGLALCGVLVWAAMNFHVFYTPDGLIATIKRQPTLADTYVDVRSWGLVQWSEYPDLAWALSHSGHRPLRARPRLETARRIDAQASR